MEASRAVEAGPSVSWVLREGVSERTEASEVSPCETEEEPEDVKENGDDGFVPGPLVPLKEQLERDKDDESLKRWKEKLLGCVDDSLNGQVEPEVTFLSIGIISNDSPEINECLPIDKNQNRIHFTLKEGSCYRLKLTFKVQYNIVSGLAYLNTVWQRGLQALKYVKDNWLTNYKDRFVGAWTDQVMHFGNLTTNRAESAHAKLKRHLVSSQVDQSKGMLGTFAPHKDPYEHILDEETTPSGVFARGNYTAKLKFEDDDKRCHLNLDYSFEIKKTC